jgi:hypothetical protein
MPPSLRSMSGTTYASRVNTTIAAPAGIVDGDTLLLAHVVGALGAAPTTTLPSGFTTLQGPDSASAGGFFVARRLAVKVASGESGSYTVTHASGSSDGVILCIQDGSTNYRSSSNGGNGTAATTTTALGVTTTRPDALVAFIAHNWALYGAGVPPTGAGPTFTEQQDSATSLIYVATGLRSALGPISDKTHANGNGVGDEGWGAFLVAIESLDTPELFELSTLIRRPAPFKPGRGR